MLSKAELEAIRERCDKATPGPWIGDVRSGIAAVYEAPYRNCLANEPEDFIAIWHGSYDAKTSCWYLPEGIANDCLFASAARSDVPALLDHIAELEARAELAERRLEALNRYWHAVEHGDACISLPREWPRQFAYTPPLSSLADALLDEMAADALLAAQEKEVDNSCQ